YHSFWYLILLGLLVLNISVCTLTRIKGVFKSMLRVDLMENESQIMRQKLNQKKSLKKEMNSIQENIITYFRNKRYKVYEKSENGKSVLFFTRGRWNRLAYPLIHLSIIFICLGGITGNLFGFKGYQSASIGEIFDAPERDFQVRVDNVWVDLTEQGQTKDFFSTLTVIENGKEVLQKTIEVNSPLEYGGLKFFQSAFGSNPVKIKNASILVEYQNQTDRKVVTISNEKRGKVPNTEYEIELKKYLSHFMLGPDNKPYSASRNPTNPAVQVSIYKGDELVETKWMFLKFPDTHSQSSIEEFKLRFMNLEPENLTGLSIDYNPGASFLWVGFILLTVGTCVGFYSSHRKYWVNLVQEEKGTVVYSGANSNKNITGLKKDFNKFTKMINKIK
ncbi:cytochrome c biogenesis protein ResB, partial [candidate division KSB1 bacterium]